MTRLRHTGNTLRFRTPTRLIIPAPSGKNNYLFPLTKSNATHYPLSIRFRKFLLNKKNKATKMEVHAHTHAERKKWTHYLWEFLMLFLAVFAGFLADNWREHIVENKREKQYIMSLVTDL